MFFLGSYMVYKRQLLFVYEPEYETGGTALTRAAQAGEAVSQPGGVRHTDWLILAGDPLRARSCVH